MFTPKITKNPTYSGIQKDIRLRGVSIRRNVSRIKYLKALYPLKIPPDFRGQYAPEYPKGLGFFLGIGIVVQSIGASHLEKIFLQPGFPCHFASSIDLSVAFGSAALAYSHKTLGTGWNLATLP